MKFPAIRPEAQELWSKADKSLVFKIASNHWCPHCQTEREMRLDSVDRIQCDLLLIGTCSVCGGQMKRVFEME